MRRDLPADQSSGTSAPWGVKGRRRTSAQPWQRRSSSSATLPASCQVVQTRTEGPAPEIVAPSAPSSAEPSRPTPSSAGRGARRRSWWMRSARPRAMQVKVGRLQPEHELRGGGDVGDRVAQRDLGRDRLAGALGGDLLGRDHGDALQATRRVEAGRAGRTAIPRPADHEPSVDRGGDVVGMPLQRSRQGQHLLPRERQLDRGGRRRRGRRRSPRRWSRGRGRAGSRCAGERRCRRRGAGSQRPARRGCHARWRRSSPPGSSENSPVSSTSSSRCSETAAAITSYPGPRLAEEAGTRISRRRAVTPGRRLKARRAAASVSQRPRARPRRGRCGS